jgi:hypothetical protein
MAVVDDCLYIAGGYGSKGHYAADIWCLQLADPEKARDLPTAAVP